MKSLELKEEAWICNNKTRLQFYAVIDKLSKYEVARYMQCGGFESWQYNYLVSKLRRYQ